MLSCKLGNKTVQGDSYSVSLHLCQPLTPPRFCNIFLCSHPLPTSIPPSLLVPTTSSLQAAKLSRGSSPDRLDSLWSCCGHAASSSNNLCICLPQHPLLSCLHHAASSKHTTASNATVYSLGVDIWLVCQILYFYTTACP